MMGEKVKSFIAQKDAEKRANIQKERAETLVKLGLADKVYSPQKVQSAEYSLPELDTTTGETRWFKYVTEEITDEEYEQLKKYINDEQSSTYNTIATVLTTIAWVTYGIGFFAGLGFIDYYGFGLTFIFWCIALISGTLFLGFAEIIKLLTAIKNK